MTSAALTSLLVALLIGHNPKAKKKVDDLCSLVACSHKKYLFNLTPLDFCDTSELKLICNQCYMPSRAGLSPTGNRPMKPYFKFTPTLENIRKLQEKQQALKTSQAAISQASAFQDVNPPGEVSPAELATAIDSIVEDTDQSTLVENTDQQIFATTDYILL